MDSLKAYENLYKFYKAFSISCYLFYTKKINGTFRDNEKLLYSLHLLSRFIHLLQTTYNYKIMVILSTGLHFSALVTFNCLLCNASFGLSFTVKLNTSAEIFWAMLSRLLMWRKRLSLLKEKLSILPHSRCLFIKEKSSKMEQHWRKTKSLKIILSL